MHRGPVDHLEALRQGTMFEAEELEHMQASSVYKVKLEHAWVGRMVANTKLRLSWQLGFGENGPRHTVELVASMRTGKREVRFDRRVIKPPSKCAPLHFEFEVAGHELIVEEEDQDGDFRFALRVDGVRFNELEDVDGDDTEQAEATIEAEMRRVRRALDAQRGDDDDRQQRKTVVAENALVSLYQVQLEPGVFGGGIQLRNEPCASRRIEVASVASPGVPGVCVGDVLVAINGKPLPRGASASELQELVRSNPRYALTAVDALMWHRKTVDRASGAVPTGLPDVEALAGSELTINCGNGALGVEWARMVAPAAHPGAYMDGLFAVVGVPAPDVVTVAVKPGDLLIGIGHEPLPKDLPSATLLQRFSSAAARGPPTLNLWRCYEPAVLDAILDQCHAAKRHALAINPSVSAVIPRKPRDKQSPNPICC